MNKHYSFGKLWYQQSQAFLSRLVLCRRSCNNRGAGWCSGKGFNSCFRSLLKLLVTILGLHQFVLGICGFVMSYFASFWSTFALLLGSWCRFFSGDCVNSGMSVTVRWMLCQGSDVQLIRTCFLITASGSKWGCFSLASTSSRWQSRSLRARRDCWCVPGSVHSRRF